MAAEKVLLHDHKHLQKHRHHEIIISPPKEKFLELNIRAPRIRNQMNLLNCSDSKNSNTMMRTRFREMVRRVGGKAE